jgi:hypothetical protein
MLNDLPLTPPVPLWTDLYLKFSSEQAAYEQLLAAGLLIETQALLAEDETVIIPAGYAAAPGASVDYIGVITKTSYPDFVPAVTAEREVEGMDGKMFTITEVVEHAVYGEPTFTDLDGWHVNVRLKADQATPANLEQYKVAPANPVRVWA